MKLIALFFLTLPSFAWASLPVLAYKSVECKLLLDGQLVKEQAQPLMTLVIEDSLGRFAQIQFGDEQTKVQYQILIENDPEDLESVIILQNLLVDTVESTLEFSGKDVSWVRATQGSHSVSCNLKP